MKNEITQAMKNSRKIKKDNELFRYVGKHDKLINVQLLDEIYKGKSVREYLHELSDAQSLIRDVKLSIGAIVVKNGYKISDNDLHTLIDQISKMQIINPLKDYFDADMTDGYISGGKPVEGEIIENKDLPDNFDNGCYRVIDYNPVLDEEKLKREMLL